MCVVTMFFCLTACDTEGPDVLGVKDGAIVDGVFKVSANKSVRFSRGNLQYTQSTKTWSFAEHQYDILVEKNIINAKYQGEDQWKGTALADKIDLFGWSSDNSTTKWGISISDNPKDYRGSFVDWGQNAILNGGNKGKRWRTLSVQEWVYLFMRNRWTMAFVVTNAGNKICGVMLLPNDFMTPKDITIVECQDLEGFSADFSDGHYDAGFYDKFDSNTYSVSQFAQLQSLGCVFIPANSPRRWGTYVDTTVSDMLYWSYDSSNNGCGCIYITDEEIYIDINEQSYLDTYRFCGYPVRLVQDI